LSNVPLEILELILWHDCKNNCKFCWQKAKNHKDKFLDESQKITSIFRAVDLVKSYGQYHEKHHLLLVGGEIFDIQFSSQLHSTFFKLIDLVVEKMVSGQIELLYVNTNLIYKDLSTLLRFLDELNRHELLSRLRFTTSYDLVGRYKTEEDRELFLSNLEFVESNYRYSGLKIVANMIMSDYVCNEILEDRFGVKEFSEEYNIKLNLLPYITLIPELSASRDKVMRTLVKVNNQVPRYLKEYVEGFLINQPRRLFEYSSGSVNDYRHCTSSLSECGHSVNFKKYSEGEQRCYVCDIKNLYETVGD